MHWTRILLGLLALADSSLSCGNHGDAEYVPEREREKLLKKWDQEVLPHIPLLLVTDML